MYEKKEIPGTETPLRQCEVRRFSPDGQGEKTKVTLLKEHCLELFLNGERWRCIVCTRSDLSTMVVGRLYTEGRIGSAADIEKLCFSEDGKQAEICLKTEKEKIRESPRTDQPLSPKPAWVLAFARRLREGMPFHRETFAAHSAFLARQGEILYACEDISRHNAVDKVIGLALLDGIPLTECMLFTSGRVPADMVEKTAAAGIPVLVSKSMPTEDAVKLAAANGICLIGKLREDGFLMF